MHLGLSNEAESSATGLLYEYALDGRDRGMYAAIDLENLSHTVGLWIKSLFEGYKL